MLSLLVCMELNVKRVSEQSNIEKQILNSVEHFVHST